MNKFSSLINKILRFSNNAINIYKLKKLAANVSLGDFTDNDVIYNTDSDDNEIGSIKTRLNSLIERLTQNAQMIEDVISGKKKDKMELVESVQAFTMNYHKVEELLSTLNDLPDSYERFMVDEDEGSVLEPAELIDFLTGAYEAVNKAVNDYTGVNVEQMSELAGAAEQQALEALDPSGSGVQYSSNDDKRRDTAKYLKEKIQEARRAEQSIPGYKSQILEKIRQAQKKYHDELKADPERWAAFKTKQKENYEERRGGFRAAFDVILRKISYKLLKYNLIRDSEVEKMPIISVHNLLPALMNLIKDESELKEVKDLKRQFDDLAEKLQFDKRLLQQRDDYRAVLTQETKNENSIIGSARLLNKKIDGIKFHKKQEIIEELQEAANTLKNQLKVATDSGNKDDIKRIKKEIQTLVENHPGMLSLENDLKAIKYSIKKCIELYPRGALQEGMRNIPEQNKPLIPQALTLLKETMNAFGSKYAITSLMAKLVKAVELQLEGANEEN